MTKRKKSQRLIVRKEREPAPILEPEGGEPVKAGNRVIRRPVTFAGDGVRPGRETPGRVIYVHPRGRFHVVEFEMAGGRRIRESFTGCGE